MKKQQEQKINSDKFIINTPAYNDCMGEMIDPTKSHIHIPYDDYKEFVNGCNVYNKIVKRRLDELTAQITAQDKTIKDINELRLIYKQFHTDISSCDNMKEVLYVLGRYREMYKI